MTTELLLESMSYVDDDLLERSESAGQVIRPRWGRWLAAAACLCLALAAVWAAYRGGTVGPTLEHPTPPVATMVPADPTPAAPDTAESKVAVHFNPVAKPPAEEKYFFALSGRALTEGELGALTPASPQGMWMDDLKALEVSGAAEIFGWNEVYELTLRFRDRDGVRVDLALRDASSPYASYGMFYPVTPEEFLTTQVEGVEVTGYRYTFEETGDTMLWATFERDGVAYWFTAAGAGEELKTAQSYIEGMVLWYLNYPITVDLGAYAN